MTGDREPVMGDIADATEPPAVVAPPPSEEVIRGRKAKGNPIRTMLLMGAAAVVLVVVAVSAMVAQKRNAPTVQAGQAANVGAVDSRRGVTATEQTTPLYREKLAQENAADIRFAGDLESGKSAVVVPPMTGSPVPSEPPAAAPVQFSPPTSRPTPIDPKEVQRKVAAAQALRARWVALPEPGVVSTGVAWDRPAVATTTEGEASALPPPPDVDLFTVYPAVIEVGANSDYPAEVIARFTGGPLRGHKVVGRMDSVGRNNANDHLQLRFTGVQVEGSLYRVDALAVDAGTRIGAVEGDVNHHMLRNIVSRAGVAYLLGYASGITLGGTGGFDSSTGAYYNSLRTGDMFRSAAATEAADALSEQRVRQPTVTLPAGSPVGIVLLSPLSTPRSTAIPVLDALGTPATATGTSGSAGSPAASTPVRLSTGETVTFTDGRR
jgi:hypothetical protein